MAEKSQDFPGMERPSIKAIDNAAEEYVQIRDKRMKLTENEVAAKTKLMDVMEKNYDKLGIDGDGNRIYRYDEMVVIFSDKKNVKVKHITSDPDED